MEDLVWVVLTGVVGGIYLLVKATREKREREERLRRMQGQQLQPSEGLGGSEPQRPVSPSQSRSRPQPQPAGSPLAELRRFFEEAQAQGRRQQEGLGGKPAEPLPSERVVAKPAQQAPRAIEMPARTPESMPARVRPQVSPPQRRRKTRPQVVPKAVPTGPGHETEPLGALVQSAAGPTSHLDAEGGPRTLAEILASGRSDLAKAIILTEVLREPVAFRRKSPVPRYR